MVWGAAVTVIRVGKKKMNVLIPQIGTQSIHMLLVATIVIITPSAYGGLRALPGSVLSVAHPEIEAQECSLNNEQEVAEVGFEPRQSVWAYAPDHYLYPLQ